MSISGMVLAAATKKHEDASLQDFATKMNVSIGMTEEGCIELVKTVDIIDNKIEDGEKHEEIMNLGATKMNVTIGMTVASCIKVVTTVGIVDSKSEEGETHEEINNFGMEKMNLVCKVGPVIKTIQVFDGCVEKVMAPFHQRKERSGVAEQCWREPGRNPWLCHVDATMAQGGH